MSQTDHAGCSHPLATHSELVGCLEPGCPCEAQPSVEDLAQGRALRDEGASHAGDGVNMVTASAWREKAEGTLAALIRWGGEFSADDLVNGVEATRLGYRDDPVHPAGEPPVPNMLGALFLSAARRDRIKAVGFTQSVRPSAHARVQRTWRGAE